PHRTGRVVAAGLIRRVRARRSLPGGGFALTQAGPEALVFGCVGRDHLILSEPTQQAMRVCWRQFGLQARVARATQPAGLAAPPACEGNADRPDGMRSAAAMVLSTGALQMFFLSLVCGRHDPEREERPWQRNRSSLATS